MRSLILSDWEVDELVYYRKRGWTYAALGNWFGIPEGTAEKIYKRERRRSEKDASSSVGEVNWSEGE